MRLVLFKVNCLGVSGTYPSPSPFGSGAVCIMFYQELSACQWYNHPNKSSYRSELFIGLFVALFIDRIVCVVMSIRIGFAP